ncbi:Adenylyltransferase and sulfurtransferase MOCS3 [Diplonema papillatum]|nr:Adenylyltransferase and sulfurtransferase MOCS3 [Diplonema papillatum]
MHAREPEGAGLLAKDDVTRYSRQLLLPDVGVDGMLKLKAGRVLVVGAGGLGSTALLYLAGAGVGTIGIVDADTVDVSNLHRQIVHTTGRQGEAKVDSAKKSLLALNPSIRVQTHAEQFTEESGLRLVSGYDVVVDATDNVAARYLINDACILQRKPLVSGAALKWEGQLSVYNYKGGLCYRCAYPNPPPVKSVTSCADGGVVGAVPGTIGALQAIEVQKVLMGMPPGKVMSGRILMFNALDMTTVTINHRPKNPDCAVCGVHPTIQSLRAYSEYLCKPCEATGGDSALAAGNEITCRELDSLLQTSAAPQPLLVDVRLPTEFAITRLRGSVNVPLPSLQDGTRLPEAQALYADARRRGAAVLLLCRRGVASVEATRILLEAGCAEVNNVKHGLTKWAQEIDPEFPMY